MRIIVESPMTPADHVRSITLLSPRNPVTRMAVFHLGAYRKMHLWDPEVLPPVAARAAALISLTLWVGVVLAGRWIGFL